MFDTLILGQILSDFVRVKKPLPGRLQHIHGKFLTLNVATADTLFLQKNSQSVLGGSFHQGTLGE